MRAKHLGNFRPSHELLYREEFQELGVQRNLRVPCISVDSVEEIVLLIIVGGEDDEVDDALENL
jgi:hypothetical protein